MKSNFLEKNMHRLKIKISENPYLNLKKINFKLPEIYLNFLVNYSFNMNENDQVYEIYCEELNENLGVFDILPSKNYSFEKVIHTYYESFSSAYFPIFISNGGGDVIVIKENGMIYYWFHEEDKFYYICHSFSEALHLIKIYEDDGKESKAIGGKGWDN